MHITTTNEYSAILFECREKIVGKRLDKFRKVRENIYRIKIGDTEYIIEPGIRFHPTKFIEKTEDKDNLCEKISKELINSRITTITQINNDRLIQIETENGSIILEMFGKGNIIIIKDSKIIAALRNEKWADREIRPGIAYIPPKGSSGEIKFDDKYVIVSILKAPIGKEYAKQILKEIQIDEKTPGNSLLEEQKQEIREKIEFIINPKNTSPVAYINKDGQVQEIAAVKFLVKEDVQIKEFKTFSEAADEYYFNYKKINPEIEKLENRLEKQILRKKELEDEEIKFKQMGDLIYLHQEKIEKLLEKVKTQKGIEDLENKGIKINKKDKKIEIELEEN